MTVANPPERAKEINRMLLGDLRSEQDARTAHVVATSTIPVPAGLKAPAWWTADDPAEASLRVSRQAMEQLR